LTVNLKYRSEEEEIMDDLDSGGPLMDRTLKELEIINKWLGGNYVTLNGIKKLIKKRSEKTIKIVDIGCGGGDMLKLIAKWAEKHDILVELIGIDANRHVVTFAENNCAGFDNINFKTVNIFSAEFEKIECDIFISTLFTHHFTEDELKSLFIKLHQQATLGVVINDIHRHFLAYHSIKLLTSLFSKSEMVKNDACLSVARAFHKNELVNILRKAQISNYSIGWYWAFRWQVVIII